MTKLSVNVASFFPYSEVRPFQGEFIKTVSDAAEDGCSVLIEGCNGLGKTIAALAACLPRALEKNFKVLYVARTHRQHDRVIEELKAISRKQKISGLSICGRHEMCLNQFVTSRAQDARAVMEVCELLKSQEQMPILQKYR